MERRLPRRSRAVAVAVLVCAFCQGDEIGDGLVDVGTVFAGGLVVERPGLVPAAERHIGVGRAHESVRARIFALQREAVFGQRLLVVATRKGTVSAQSRRLFRRIVAASGSAQRKDRRERRPRQHRFHSPFNLHACSTSPLK